MDINYSEFKYFKNKKGDGPKKAARLEPNDCVEDSRCSSVSSLTLANSSIVASPPRSSMSGGTGVT